MFHLYRNVLKKMIQWWRVILYTLLVKQCWRFPTRSIFEKYMEVYSPFLPKIFFLRNMCRFSWVKKGKKWVPDPFGCLLFFWEKSDKCFTSKYKQLTIHLAMSKTFLLLSTVKSGLLGQLTIGHIWSLISYVVDLAHAQIHPS